MSNSCWGSVKYNSGSCNIRIAGFSCEWRIWQHRSRFLHRTMKWVTSSLLSSSDSWCDDDVTDLSLALSALATVVWDLWVNAEPLAFI
jgi:hypothetical protein